MIALKENLQEQLLCRVDFESLVAFFVAGFFWDDTFSVPRLRLEDSP